MRTLPSPQDPETPILCQRTRRQANGQQKPKTSGSVSYHNFGIGCPFIPSNLSVLLLLILILLLLLLLPVILLVYCQYQLLNINIDIDSGENESESNQQHDPLLFHLQPNIIPS